MTMTRNLWSKRVRLGAIWVEIAHGSVSGGFVGALTDNVNESPRSNRMVTAAAMYELSGQAFTAALRALPHLDGFVE